MRMTSIRLGVILSLCVVATAAAQGPPAGRGPGGMQGGMQGGGMGPGAGRGSAPGANFLLASTGTLQLTDAQVVKLAAIVRRGEARRQSMRTAMDSMRSRMMGTPMPGDSAMRVRRQAMMGTMQGNMERMREQERADLRDAIAVLTPDQQARAWEMMANRGERGGRGVGQGQRQMRRRGPPAPARQAPPNGQ